MTVTLPSGAGSHRDHNPFPGSLACIVGFEDTVSNAKTVTMVIYFVIERRILHRQDLVGFDAVANLWGSIPQPSLDGSLSVFVWSTISPRFVRETFVLAVKFNQANR